MSRFDVQNGVDYLIDYYALLGIEWSASAGEITQAYRAKQKQYHTDRFQGLAPELLEQAERQSHLINEAYAILNDSTKKSEYDQTLATWKKPLSKHGEVVVDFNDASFSFTTLLGNLTADPQEREQKAEVLALQFSGFEKATYEFFRKQADTPTGIPQELKAAYLEQLERRELYLSLREGFLWDSMGQRNHAPVPRLEYTEQTREHLEEVKKNTLENITHEVLLLAAGERALLAAPEGMHAEIDTSRVLDHYKARIDEHFDRQTALLKPLAEEREQILEARFVTGAQIIYHPDTKVYTEKLVMEVKNEVVSVWLVFEFEDKNIKGSTPDGLEILTQLEVAREWMERGYTIVSFQAVQGIDFHSQLERVLNQHGEILEHQKLTN